MVELLKQGQYLPLSVSEQIAMIFAGTEGHLDEVPVEAVQKWEAGFVDYFETKGKAAKDLLDANLNNGKAMKSKDDETTQAVVNAIQEFNKTFTP